MTAKFTAGIETKATGPLTLSFGMSEERAQDIFAMLLGTTAQIVDARNVPDPNNPKATISETYQRPRTLGECLRNEITVFIMDVETRAIAYKQKVAADAAAATVNSASEVSVIK